MNKRDGTDEIVELKVNNIDSYAITGPPDCQPGPSGFASFFTRVEQPDGNRIGRNQSRMGRSIPDAVAVWEEWKCRISDRVGN